MRKYYGLSSAQTRIYIDQLLNPGSSFANICYTVVLKSAPGAADIKRALNRVLLQQDGLRLKFASVDGEVFQYVEEHGDRDFETLEFDSEEDENYLRWTAEQASTAFELYDSEMFHFAVIIFKNGGRGFFARMHHLVHDGMSVRALVSDFKKALAGKGPSPEPQERTARAVSYLDFLKYESEYERSEKFEEHGRYWVEKLSPLPEVNPLFEGKNRIRNIRSLNAEFCVPSETHGRILDCCAKLGISRFAFFMAAVLTYFSKASGRRDMLVGFPHHGRHDSSQKRVCGMFVSTVPFRFDVPEETEFSKFAAGAFQEMKTILREYHRYPFNRIASELKKKSFDLAGALDINLVEVPNLKDPEVEIKYYLSDEDPSTFNMYLITGADEKNDPLKVRIVYRADLFSAAETAMIFERIMHFIGQAVENPDAAIRDIAILTESEKRRLLVDFNDTRADYPLDKTIHELFREAAAAHPDKTALVFRDRRYSYGELDSITDRLANHLRGMGVGPGAVCGILVKRSEDIVIALLGVLKAGGAYLPIDPQYPDDRIAYMLEDSGAAVLLGHAGLRVKAAGFGGEWVDLDAREYMGASADKPSNLNASGDLVYIIYTSGSTGKPKGVMVEHRNIVNLCMWQNDFHGVTAADVAAAYSGFSFDASIWEMLPFITRGAELHIIADEIRLSIDELNDYFNANGVTITNLPTQFCEQFMETADNRSLRTLVTGGDKLRSYRPSKFRLVNEYGPTEYTISATAFVVEKPYDNIPIGRPLANTWLYVVNSAGELLPAGAPGELWIAGAQTARGYLNRPDLTAQKFIVNPFKTCEMNARAYKTGDLVRWTAEGVVEYLGRIDQQVKIRGYRIELGEIEQQLLKVEGVRDAAVIDAVDRAGNKYLSAYVVARNGAMDTDAIKRSLARELPDYMIPSYFTMIESIPLTPNGKVDRRALPVPAIEPAGGEYEAPAEGLEKKLAELWAEILKAERVGANDDFFALGGHSLKASALQAKIQKTLRLKVPLADIFDYPVLRDMAARLKGLAQADLPPLKKAVKAVRNELSAAQMSVFVLNDNQDSLTGYNIPLVNVIEGRVDPSRLENAIRQILKRHEALRSRFERDDALGAVQIIEDEVEFKLEYFRAEDVENILRVGCGPKTPAGADADRGLIDRLANAFIKRFDLAAAPLLNAALIELGAGRSLLVISVHHIIFDGASAGIFMGELESFYNGKSLPEPKFQYGDYVAWRKSFGESDAYRSQARYWLETFADGVPTLNLTADFTRPASQSFEGAKHYFTIGPELLGEIEKLAAETGSTLYHVLLGAWYALLYRYTGQEDLAVGTPVAGRPLDELSGVIGMFVNTVVVRARPRGGMSFLEFLKHVKTAALGALDNQHYEFFELVKSLGVERDPSRNPVFDAMFVLQNAGAVTFETPDFTMKPWKLQNGVSQVDLTLEAEKIGENLELLIEYCVKLFRPDTIKRMAGHLLNILQAVVRDSNVALERIDMLTPAEKKTLLADFNDTALPVPLEKTVPQLFREQTAARGARTALVCGSVRYTYAELDEKTDSLAAVLREKGVGRDTVVAVMVRRSADIMVGALAIMKAGGAYLPVDADYPPDRIAYMLEDSGAAMLLTHGGLRDKFAGSKIEWLDLADSALYRKTPAPLEPTGGPCDLAYVIYTSGSTGKPKGVMIEQRNLVNLCAWHNHYHGVTFEDVAAAYSGFGFDASIWEMFPFITCGAALHIITEDIRLDPGEVDGYFARNGVTITNLPTQFCEQFMEMTDNRTLKTLVTGGDKLRGFKKRGYRLVNEYGPTEYTISATAYLVEGPADNIPIGKPLANTWIYILDGALNLLPQGVPGELCISGAQMARGYLNRPELTAEKFIKNPYARSAMNERLYRTGDLARWLPDGNIEFLGRIDQQVKIRGYRIELGEIEQQLLACPGVSNAVVLDLADKSGMKYLCAYVVGAAAETDLKASLAKNLPEYMVPSAFVFVGEIPLTPNGKIDKKALPAPQASPAAARAEYAPPSGEREEALAAAWSEVLGVKNPGANDNFFSLGGDSIKVIQIAARLRKYGYKLDTRKAFAAPTIAKLAKYLERGAPQADNSPVSGAVPLTPIQKWFFEQNFKYPDHWNQSVVIEAAGAVDESALRLALGDIVAHHDALRMIYSFGAGGVLQYNRDTGAGEFFGLRVFELKAGGPAEALDEIKASSAALQESVRLQAGVLLQAGLFKAAPGSGVKDHISLVIHHLVVDAVSWEVIREDLEAAYLARAAGAAPSLADKTASYKEWAEKMEKYASGRAVDAARPYWKEVDAFKVEPLPVDGIYSDVADRRVEELELSAEKTAKLSGAVRDALGATIEEALLAGLAGAVKLWSGGKVPVTAVTLESHGRSEALKISTARTVGWFTATYPVVIDASGEDWHLTLKDVKENMRCVPNRGFDYEIIHRAGGSLQGKGVCEKVRPEIEFNYFGEAVSGSAGARGFFKIVDTGAGEDSDPREAPDFKLSVGAALKSGALKISIAYDGGVYRPETIEKLRELYSSALDAIASACRGREREYTRSDIADAGLSVAEFNAIKDFYGPGVERIYPLAPMQEGMLFFNMASSGGASEYIEQAVYRLEGEMDEELFASNFSSMIAHYDILRTGFTSGEIGVVRQVVMRGVEARPVFEDHTGAGLEVMQGIIESACLAQREAGFDLRRPPLFRAAVLKFSGGVNAVILTFPHIILDGWSAGLIEKYLLIDYCFLKAGAAVDRNASAPFGNYINWLGEQDRDEATGFWRGYLEGVAKPTLPPGASLAKKAEGPAVFADREFTIPVEKASKLLELAGRYNVTLGVVLQAVWGIVLMRHNASREAVFGMVTSGRGAALPDIEQTAGLFINTIPVRVVASPMLTFAGLIARMQESSVAAERYCWLSLAEISRVSGVRGALVNSLLSIQTVPRNAAVLPRGFALSEIGGFDRISYDFSVVMAPSDGIAVRFNYNAAVYDEYIVEAVAEDLEALIEEVLASPEGLVDGYRLAPPAGPGGYKKMPPAKRGGFYPASAVQRRICREARKHSGGAFFTLGSYALIEGRLDKARLVMAANRVAERHEILRTAFGPDPDAAAQCVAEEARLEVAFGKTTESGLAEALREAYEKHAASWDLSLGPLVSAALFEIAPARHVFALNAHASVMDRASFDLFFEELALIYAGEEPAELPAQYGDHAEWENSPEYAKIAMRSGLYWKRSGLTEPPELVLPYDRKKKTVKSLICERLEFEISPETFGALEKLCEASGCDTQDALLAAFCILLRGYGGPEEIVVAATAAAVKRPEFSSNIGPFEETFPLRCFPGAEKTIRELIAEVRGERTRILSGGHCAPESPSDDGGAASGFAAAFAYARGAEMVRDGLSFSRGGFLRKFFRHDLALEVRETGGELQAAFEYSPDLFDASTVSRIAGHFSNVISAVCSSPGMAIAGVGIMSAEEKNRVLNEFNATLADAPLERTAHSLFRAAAAANPDRTALVFRDKKYSYRELDRLTDGLAVTLRGMGVGPNTICAVIVKRSEDMAIAALGIMKAGGAFLPIDPAYPDDRIVYMLEDSGAPLVVGHREFRDRLPGFDGEWLNVEERAFAGAAPPPEDVNSSGDLAYVIYTSGSTGKPKGVMVEHRGLANLCAWHNRFHGATAGDAAAAYSGFSFDASVLESLPILTCGAELHVLPDEIRLSPEAVNEYLEKKGITIAFMPTQFAEQFCESMANGSLRHLGTGGEKLGKFTPQRFQINNCYGPTEYTVVTMAFALDGEYENIPIGKPVSNTWIYVVDGNGSPVPIGVPGEMWVSGAQIARGYLNMPDLTREKFIDNPFKTCEMNSRAYRTGDLVRWKADGNLEYIGRRDRQVKIRGYRIELGEIEHQLLKFANVKQAVVIDLPEPSGGSYLSAYLVAAPGEKADVDYIKSALAKELPQFMVPSFFTFLDRIPMTPDGKVDKKALPAPVIASTAAGGAAPSTPAEIEIAEAWKAVLGVENIGANDDFFASGGNSIKAIALVSKLSKKFSVKVNDVFEYPTVAAMASNLKSKPAAVKGDSASGFSAERRPSIPRAPEKEYYPLSYSQKRMFVLDTMQSGESAYHITAALSIEGALDRSRLGRAVDAVVRRHESLRTSFELIDGEPFQKINRTVKLKKNYRRVEESAVRDAIDDFIKPFDLSRPPLFRVLLLETAPGRHIFMMDFHHIIIDGISLGTFFEELFAFYRGAEPAPPALQYRDYSEWEGGAVFAGSLEAKKEFWLKTFETPVTPLTLPCDRQRPAVRRSEGGVCFRGVNASTTAALKKLASESGATMFMVLLAAFNVMLHKYSGSEDIVVGTPCSGRADSALEGVIGMFVSTLPVRNYPRPSQTFREFLGGVRSSSINSFTSQEYPFDRLVEDLKVKRDPSRNPLFDVMFSYNEKTSLEVEGLRIEDYDAADRKAQFDLTFDAFGEGDTIDFALEYSAALFDERTAERMAGHAVRLLERIAADPDARIADIDMMTPEESDRVLREFNATLMDVPFDKTVHELFRTAAAEHPDKTALVFRDKRLTYRELDGMTDKLALYLRERGVGPDTVSAILVNRSAEIVIAALGIMKAGGAYLPIDPAYPDERIRYMLEDSGAVAALGQSALRGRVEGFGGEWVDLDARAYIDETGGAPANVNKPSDLVYVIYTSGSTGKPKGVMVEHRNLVNLCVWHNRFHGVTFEDRAAAYSGFSFDASIWEMLPFITCGAELHIIADGLRLSPENLNDYFNANGITITNLPTQFCEQFMETAGETSLKTLVTGGDKLRGWKKTGYRLVNEYGPTEYTISATAFVVDRHYDNIPIGRPLANTWLYVVDKFGKPVPIGVPGELWIAGAQTARGYMNRPELTAEKFIDNPFKTCELNSRAYRTGDLVRWTADGVVEFLGRIDQQVKIRGYRIEPGEIERLMIKLPGVKDAAVVDLDDGAGNKYLSAYAVFDAGAPADFDAMKRALGRELPEYMVPSRFTALDSIPLTPNGKVDRRALPSPVALESAGGFVEPSTDNEKKIARVWKEVLGVEKIGAGDDFFLIGGNSIRAIAAVSKLSKTFEISINDIFEHQTLSELAKHLRPKQNNLKLKLAAIMDEIESGAGNLAETAAFREEMEKAAARYDAENEKYSALDISVRKSYREILLTGATGFLGAHLVKKLLEGGSRLTLIVRGKSDEDARARVIEKLSYYFGEGFPRSPEFAAARVLRGDLSAERLGLSSAEYDRLASETDAVIHSAANVKHYGHYDEFYRDNVAATANLLEFAGAGRPKDFGFVSTVSVGSGALEGRDFAFFTESDLDFGQTHDNYYLKTKFLAEKEVVKARGRGINASIFRVGNLVFDSATGIYQQNIDDNAFYNQVKSYLNIGAIPEMADEAEFSYVDRAAAAICSLFGREALPNETFHIWNPEPVRLSELFTGEKLGLNIERMASDRFADHLYDNLERAGMSGYIEQIMTHLGWLDDPESREAHFEVFSGRTEMLLKKAGFEWPRLEPEKLSKMIGSVFAERVGFLKSVPVFSALGEEELLDIAGQARQKVFKNNEDMLWEGVESDEFFVVVDGCVEICRNSIDGWTGTLMVSGPQSIIGEENFVLRKPSCITAESIMGDSLVLAFNYGRIRERLMNNPGAVAELLKMMAEKITRLERLIVSMG